MQKSAIRKVRTVFGISLLLLLLSSVAAYLSLGRLLDSEAWLQHTYQVINRLQGVVSGMKDAETGYRGYLLTGREEFLEPYHTSRSEVLSAFTEAQRLTSDNDQQQRDFPKLRLLIDSKFETCTHLIEQRRSGLPVSEQELLLGKAEMDHIRLFAAAMVEREQKLMLLRSSKTEVFIRYTPLVVVLAALIGIGLAVWFYFRLLKDMRDREEMSEQLREVNEKTQKSIQEIGEVAKKIADGDYSARIPSDSVKKNKTENGDHHHST